ncbi:MAG: OsmC family protein [Pyrinomonadaceae bacterium]
MKINARVDNSPSGHSVSVSTNGAAKSIVLPPKDGAPGSEVNGGELLFLALATCYCNDIYREAAKMGVTVRRVAVTVEGEFGGVGEPARGITYAAEVDADASEELIRDLMRHTDRVAEIHNTLRAGASVELRLD